MRRRIIPIAIISTCFLAWLGLSAAMADRMYVTITESEAAGSISKDGMMVKLGKKDSSAEELFLVDTQARTEDVLWHPAGRRYYVLVYDLVFESPDNLLKARNLSEVFLSRVGEDDLIAVASISRRYGLQFHSGFTTDRDKIRAGLNLIGKKAGDDFSPGPEGNFYRSNFSSGPSVELIPADQFVQQIKDEVVAADSEEKRKKRDHRGIFVQGISNLSFHLSAVPGRKNILLFTPGFDAKGVEMRTEDAGFVDQYVEAAISDPITDGRANSEGSDIAQQRYNQYEATQRKGLDTMNTLPINVEGIPEFVAGSDSHIHVLKSGSREYGFFQNLVKESRGSYLSVSDDAQPVVDQILASDSKFYVIGWDGLREKEFKEPASFKVEESGKKVDTPSQWIVPRFYDEYSSLERRLFISGAVYHHYREPSAGERFLADYYWNGDQMQVLSYTELEGKDIIARDVAELEIDLYTFLQDGEGNLIDSTYLPLHLDLSSKSLSAKVAESGVRVWDTLLSNDKAAQIKWIIHYPQFGDTATKTISLSLGSAGIQVSSPFLLSRNFDWHMVPAPMEKLYRRGQDMSYPYRAGENVFFPDLAKSIPQGQAGQALYFKVYGVDPTSKTVPFRLELIDANGKGYRVYRLAPMQEPKDLGHNGKEFLWQIQALPNVSPGAYTLRLSVPQPNGEGEVVREIPVAITSG